MRDKNGKELKVGDEIVVRYIITEVHEDEFLNITAKLFENSVQVPHRLSSRNVELIHRVKSEVKIPIFVVSKNDVKFNTATCEFVIHNKEVLLQLELAWRRDQCDDNSVLCGNHPQVDEVMRQLADAIGFPFEQATWLGDNRIKIGERKNNEASTNTVPDATGYSPSV